MNTETQWRDLVKWWAATTAAATVLVALGAECAYEVIRYRERRADQ